jgi:hypothetical protein
MALIGIRKKEIKLFTSLSGLMEKLKGIASGSNSIGRILNRLADEKGTDFLM